MRIGEVARKAGVATSAIRFYEDEGLLPVPERTASGYRDYDPSVIDRLAFLLPTRPTRHCFDKLQSDGAR